jgi:hypothetical protein
MAQGFQAGLAIGHGGHLMAVLQAHPLKERQVLGFILRNQYSQGHVCHLRWKLLYSHGLAMSILHSVRRGARWISLISG